MIFEKLLKEEGLMSLLLDSCVNGISLSDPAIKDNPIVYVNQAFERLSGYKSEEIVGKNCRFLQGEDRDQENVQHIKKAIAEKQPIECELRNYRKDGQLFYNYLSISPILNKSGECIYFLGIQYDITKQVLAAEEMRRINKFLEDYIRHPGY